MANNHRIIAFIDLLGTKESHKVSDASFEEHMEIFLKALLINATVLDENHDKIHHFSDCTFIFTESEPERLFKYLNILRNHLLNKELYFKGGIAFSGGQIYNQAEAENKVFGSISNDVAKKIKNICSFQLFGPDVVPAYLKHETLKGVGYHVDEKISEKYHNLCVNSIFVSDKHSTPYVPFKDIRYTGRLVDTIFDPDEYELNRKEEDREYAKEYESILKNFFEKKRAFSLDGKRRLSFQKNNFLDDEHKEQFSKYPPAEPGALVREPLKAANQGR